MTEAENVIEAPIPEGSTLRLTSKPLKESLDETEEELKKFDEGEEVNVHTVNIVDMDELRSLLTEKRRELLNSLIDETAESIRDLARRLDRDVKDVHEDLQILEKYGIVRFKERGRAKIPYVPYDNVRIEVEMSGKKPTI